MAVPTLTKTWQFSVNNATGAVSAIDVNRTWLLGVKNALTSFASSPWAMRYSCNSVTAGSAGDGVDRITTNANLVWANAGSAHSWFVLRQTGIATNYELLLSCESASGTGQSLLVVVSPAAGFTGGSTTARPTATDEIILSSGSSWGINSATQLRWHAMQSTDGECTRIITLQSGAIQNQIMLEKPYQPTSGWTNPSVSNAGIGTACLNASTLGSLTGPSGRARIGATVASILMTCEGGASVGASTVPTNATFFNMANEVSGEWPIAPIGIASPTVGTRGRHGTIQDLWMGSIGANTGDTYPSGTSRQFAQFDDVIFPWDGSVPLLT